MLQYTSTVHLDKTQFIQTLDRECKFVDAGIYIENCNVLSITNSIVQLQIARTSVTINGKNDLVIYLIIENCSFIENKNSPSTSTFFIENVPMILNDFRTVVITKCNFSNNSNGLSVITVKNSQLKISNCLIADNNMTGITVMDNGKVNFTGTN